MVGQKELEVFELLEYLRRLIALPLSVSGNILINADPTSDNILEIRPGIHSVNVIVDRPKDRNVVTQLISAPLIAFHRLPPSMIPLVQDASLWIVDGVRFQRFVRRFLSIPRHV